MRILAITVGSTMAAMIIKVPPHWGQCSLSIPNTRLSNRVQLMRAGADGGGTSPCSAEVSWVLTGALGMISGRRLAREHAVEANAAGVGATGMLPAHPGMEASNEREPWTGDERGQPLHEL